MVFPRWTAWHARPESRGGVRTTLRDPDAAVVLGRTTREGGVHCLLTDQVG